MHALTNRKSNIGNRKSAGFSLIELITVTAILTIVLSGILAVFLGSMKAVRQGYRHMDAYEMSRGAFQVVQRDLTGAFTSREHGDYHQFFGTPYGMTFVGTVSNFQGIGNNQGDNLCRVSYVIRQITGDPAAVDPDPLDDKIIPDPLDAIETNDGPKPAYVLIRFIELGVDNLDNFPVDWTGNAYGASAEWAAEAANLQAEYNAAASRTDVTTAEHDRLLAMKKRELWLRMLRGRGVVYASDDTYQYPSSVAVPDFFQVAGMFASQYPLTGLDVRDYIVATNIYFNPIEVGEAEDLQSVTPLYPIFGIKAFSYGLPQSYGIPASRPTTLSTSTPTHSFGQHQMIFANFWNAEWTTENLPEFHSPLRVYGGEGSPLLPRIPAAVHFHLRMRFPAPNVAAAEIERVLDQTIDVPSAYWRAQMGLS